jgi:hypothetical protein
MMTDTIIANLPADGLRSILRSLLGLDVKTTLEFHRLAANYLYNTTPLSSLALFTSRGPSPEFYDFQRRYRCLMGCGEGFQSLEALNDVILQSLSLDGREFDDLLVDIDSDIVQAMTAVQKQLTTSGGLRSMTYSEVETVKKLESTLLSSQKQAEIRRQDFGFQRGLPQIESLSRVFHNLSTNLELISRSFKAKPSDLETTKLGNHVVPRMFMGLWQFSSSAWGSAPRSKMNENFRKHIDAGFVAYGKRVWTTIDTANR